VNCLVVVAHPDDETIWAGGTILRHCDWDWSMLALSRRDDPDRAPRFARAVAELGARGWMCDLDDSSPVLAALSPDLHEIKSRIRRLPAMEYDLILTHGPDGEYTRHERHEQVHRAVCEMTNARELRGRVFCFAYGDCAGGCRPHPEEDARVEVILSADEYRRKQYMVRDIYGFGDGSFEQSAAGPVEAFNLCVGAEASLPSIPWRR
jgi:LmbE family N-acetylglucosaminyl deacetylase